ncbi:hypothetical protein LIER_23995 [Lithospermum erythrorhizon]|uniref:Uncharacterized protein n=1 Tax=Lithospermum erythrorhizon TaxID=34254 RepID=A0AAV3R0R6_LITER
MQISVSYVDNLMNNIDSIRCSGGAIVEKQEVGGSLDEISIEITGSTSQVEAALDLIKTRFDEECFHDFLYGIKKELYGHLRSSLLAQDPPPILDRAYQAMLNA